MPAAEAAPETPTILARRPPAITPANTSPLLQPLPKPPGLANENGPVPPVAVELILLSATAIWGFTFPLVKTALHHIGPIEFLAIRFAIATVALVIIWPRAALQALRSGRKAGGR